MNLLCYDLSHKLHRKTPMESEMKSPGGLCANDLAAAKVNFIAVVNHVIGYRLFL